MLREYLSGQFSSERFQFILLLCLSIVNFALQYGKIRQNANSGKPPIVKSVIQGNANFLLVLVHA